MYPQSQPSARKYNIKKIALATALVIGFIGFMAWTLIGGNPSSTSRTTKKATPSAPPDSKITSGPGAEWNTYTNTKLGFSFKIPKRVYSLYGGECRLANYDDNGNTVPAYDSVGAVVPTNVVSYKNDFYVVPKYTYQLSDAYTTVTDSTLYRGCHKETTTYITVYNNSMTRLKAAFSYLQISVFDAPTKESMLEPIHKFFGSDTQVLSLTDSAAGPWQEFSLGCVPGAYFGACEISEPHVLRYFPAKHKLLYISLSKPSNLQTPDGQNFYDQQVIDSIKIL